MWGRSNPCDGGRETKSRDALGYLSASATRRDADLVVLAIVCDVDPVVVVCFGFRGRPECVCSRSVRSHGCSKVRLSAALSGLVALPVFVLGSESCESKGKGCVKALCLPIEVTPVVGRKMWQMWVVGG